MQLSSSPPPSRVGIPAPSPVGSRLLLGALLLLSLAVYLIILIPHRANAVAAPQWLDLAQFAAAFAALTTFLTARRSTVKTVHPAYFQFAALGIAVSLAHILFGLHWDSIETSASLLQTAAWAMTTLLAWVAMRNNHPQQARQWLARSVAVAATSILLPMLPFLPRYPRLHPDSLGLQKGIVVFAAFLIADIALNWREITTARA